jgi:hypothetical protein
MTFTEFGFSHAVREAAGRLSSRFYVHTETVTGAMEQSSETQIIAPPR